MIVTTSFLTLNRSQQSNSYAKLKNVRKQPFVLQNNVLRTLRNFMNTEVGSARSLRREYGVREGTCMFILLLKFGS